jgi:hypothetical protein
MEEAIQQRGDRLVEDDAKKGLKPMPKFESEDEEREFWATHDSADYVDWSRPREARPASTVPRARRD